MASPAETMPTVRRIAPFEITSIWARHALSLYLPLNALAFLWTGPHSWWVAILFMAPLVLAHLWDTGAAIEGRQPETTLPAWPFDLLVYALAALQLWVIFELVRLFTVQGLFSVDMVMAFLVVGGSSGFSIITAHELIHRKPETERWLGRLLLCTVLYEHFFTEHLRGHHVRVGTDEDPATARFGEDYESFWRRTVPAQFRSAWRLEARRLGDPDMRLLDRRMWRNRILHGLAIEWALVVGIGALAGPVALLAFLLQAYSAVRLLEAVNYFEHWGLLRRERRVRPVDSWDTHSWFTYYALTGLSRHADHHAFPARPYQQLRVFDEAPILPFGYVGMVDMVMGRNAEFQEAAALELGRRGAGPFEAPHTPASDAAAALERVQAERAAAHPPREPGALRRAWRAVPAWPRGLAVAAAFVAATAAGAEWEAGDTAVGWPTRALAHAAILGVLAVVIPMRRRVQDRTGSEPLSWVLAFALLAAAGWLGAPYLP